MEIITRMGIQSDVYAIYELLKELAIHNNEMEGFLMTPQKLEEDGFGENPAFSVIVAETQGQVVGIALFCNRYSSWRGRALYLVDLVVTKKLRRKGIGKLLFDALVQHGLEIDTNRISWTVLRDNKEARNFYEKINASTYDLRVSCSLIKDQLASYEFSSK